MSRGRIDLAGILDHLEDAALALHAAEELIGPQEEESAYSLSYERLHAVNTVYMLAHRVSDLAQHMRMAANE